MTVKIKIVLYSKGSTCIFNEISMQEFNQLKMIQCFYHLSTKKLLVSTCESISNNINIYEYDSNFQLINKTTCKILSNYSTYFQLYSRICLIENSCITVMNQILVFFYDQYLYFISTKTGEFLNSKNFCLFRLFF